MIYPGVGVGGLVFLAVVLSVLPLIALFFTIVPNQ